MKNKDIEKAIRSGDVIITTKSIVKEAVKQAVSGLYSDTSDFENNRYMTAREFEQLSDRECEDLANDVLEYIID